MSGTTGVVGKLLVVLSSVALTACGGRTAQPVSFKNTYDELLTCEHLKAERQVNLDKITSLHEERSFETRNNVGILLLTPAFIDLSDSEKKEVEALVERNERVSTLMQDRGCVEVAAEAQ